MNIFQTLKDRIGAVVASVLGAVFACICGAAMTFYFAPKQALEANRIANLPQMDAGYVAAAAPGSEILVTGTLSDNAPQFGDSQLVAYTLHRWDVTVSIDDEGHENTSGSWEKVETMVPELNLNMGGQILPILSAQNPSLGGALHEEMVYSDSPETAYDSGANVPDGSLRYKGYYNGDLLTVFGQKASTGGVIPTKLFGGDRVAFEQGEVDAAKGLLYGGIGLMACAPVILFGGILGAIFGRRRKGLLG